MTWDWKVLVAVVVVAAAMGWWLTRSVHEPAIDFVAVDRDLTELATALRADAGVDIEVVPQVSAGLRFPTSIQYRRATDFWGSVLGRGARFRGSGRAGRRTPQ